MSTIRRVDFTILRSPDELARYVQATYNCIRSDPELFKPARLRKEPYKTFLEELIPFSHFCTWKYGNCTDIQCALLSDTSLRGTPDHDAVVIDKKKGTEHVVELTWPIDGEYMIHQVRQMNEKGRTDIEIWDYNDDTKQENAVQRVLDIARKKCLRDYHAPGGSSIIFVFDQELFWDDNPKHIELLSTLVSTLSTMPLRVDHILLMSVLGESQKIVEIGPV